MSDEKVYKSKNGQSGGVGKKYHTDNTCQRFPDEPIKCERSTLESWGYEECKFCSDKVNYPTERQPSLREKINNGEL